MAARYSDESLRKAVLESTSFAQVLRALGLRPAGGNYAVLRRKLKLLKIDVSHFLGKGYLKGKANTWAPRTPLEMLLVVDSLSGVTTTKLKARLLKEGLLHRRCSRCGLTDWQGQPIPLELEHRNGIRSDNRLSNLNVLCPNCHALTSTYRGRNKRRK